MKKVLFAIFSSPIWFYLILMDELKEVQKARRGYPDVRELWVASFGEVDWPSAVAEAKSRAQGSDYGVGWHLMKMWEERRTREWQANTWRGDL